MNISKLFSNIFSRATVSKAIASLSLFAIVAFPLASSASAQIAVRGETVWTMTGEPITNGVVLVKDGKIEAVGTAAQVRIPDGYRIVNAKVLTPGLIDAHTVIGLNGYLNQPHDQMALDGGASMLRAELIKAQEASKKSEPSTDLKTEIMVRVVKREVPLLVTAEKAQDIITALRIAKEFNIRIVLDGASDAPLVLNEIRDAGVSVILHPTMARPGGDRENLAMTTAKKLKDAGILFAIQSGYEGYVPKTRVVLFEAAMAANAGLGKRDALASITIDAARIIGLDSRVGSLAVGKDADIAMYDGDPFEYTTKCVGTMINGRIVSEEAR